VKKILAIITSVALVAAFSLEMLGFMHIELAVSITMGALWLTANSLFMASLIGRNTGKPALPKEVLKTGSMIKIADADFYVVLGDEAVYIIPVFILDVAKKIDPKDPTYIKFSLNQIHSDSGQPLRIRTGYNYIWNGEKLIPATQ
jgi:hypothetical protein